MKFTTLFAATAAVMLFAFPTLGTAQEDFTLEGPAVMQTSQTLDIVLSNPNQRMLEKVELDGQVVVENTNAIVLGIPYTAKTNDVKTAVVRVTYWENDWTISREFSYTIGGVGTSARFVGRAFNSAPHLWVDRNTETTVTVGQQVDFPIRTKDDQGNYPVIIAGMFGDGGTFGPTNATGPGANGETYNLISHTFTAAGRYRVTINAKDTAATPLESQAVKYVNVVNGVVPTSVDIGGPRSLMKGETGNFVASISSPSGQACTQIINWGDGSTVTFNTSGGNASVSHTHAYANAGTYTVTLSSNCDGAQDSHTLVVYNVVQPQPVLSITGPVTLERNVTGWWAAAITATIGQICDQTINWGDGSTVTFQSIGNYQNWFSHIYSAAGVYNVTLTSSCGGSVSTSVVVTEPGGNNGTVINITGPTSIVVNQANNWTISVKSDDDCIQTINWGDGVVETVNTVGTESKVVTHTYLISGTFTIEVTSSCGNVSTYLVVNVSPSGMTAEQLAGCIPTNVSSLEPRSYHLIKLTSKKKGPRTAADATPVLRLGTFGSCQLQYKLYFLYLPKKKGYSMTIDADIADGYPLAIVQYPWNKKLNSTMGVWAVFAPGQPASLTVTGYKNYLAVFTPPEVGRMSGVLNFQRNDAIIPPK